jgi:hypothetical protein
MPAHFLAYRGNGSVQAPRDGAKGVTRGDTSRNLFTLTETEDSRRATPVGRNNAAGRLQQAVNRRLTLVKRASDPKNRLARLIPSPKLLA